MKTIRRFKAVQCDTLWVVREIVGISSQDIPAAGLKKGDILTITLPERYNDPAGATVHADIMEARYGSITIESEPDEAMINRIKNARSVLAIYEYDENDIHTAAVDSLTDLMHLACGQLDLESVMRSAQGNYDEEKAE